MMGDHCTELARPSKGAVAVADNQPTRLEFGKRRGNGFYFILSSFPFFGPIRSTVISDLPRRIHRPTADRLAFRGSSVDRLLVLDRLSSLSTAPLLSVHPMAIHPLQLYFAARRTRRVRNGQSRLGWQAIARMPTVCSRIQR